MPHFLLRLLVPRPTFAADMTAEERQIMMEHAAYWRALLEDGTAIAFGPVADPAGAWGVALVSAPDQATVRRLADGDPAITSGRGFSYAILPMGSLVTRDAGAPNGAPQLFADFDEEWATTRRFLERYPDGRGTWRPDGKSRTLGQLATHVAGIVHLGVEVLTTDERQVGSLAMPPLDAAADLVRHLDEGLARFNAALSAATPVMLDRSWALKHGEHVIVEHPRRRLLRQLVMSHLIHHRAQLGVYYRLLGLPVPSAYGPTADT